MLIKDVHQLTYSTHFMYYFTQLCNPYLDAATALQVHPTWVMLLKGSSFFQLFFKVFFNALSLIFHTSSHTSAYLSRNE